MNDCQLVPTGIVNGPWIEFVCGHCKRKKWSKYSDPVMVHRRCGTGVPEQAAERPLFQRGWSYAKALARWAAAGRPRRSQEEITEILIVCRACPYFRPGSKSTDNGHCKLCGCGLSEKNQVTNKAMMATENCPEKKW